MSDNMKIWNAVEVTNPAFTTSVNQRGGFTAIDAYYQIRQATELWGTYGGTWGLRHLKRELHPEMEMATLDAEFYYPGGSFEIGNSIELKISTKNGMKWDDEFVKKLETNTLSKALSKLGFGADVFMGKFDDMRYIRELNKKFGNQMPDAPSPPPSPISQVGPRGGNVPMSTSPIIAQSRTPLPPPPPKK